MRFAITAVMLSVWSAAAFAQDAGTQPAKPGAVQIDLKGTGDTRTPIAVPYFAAAPGAEADAKELTEVVAFDLDFTGLFYILSPKSYPADFRGFTADPAQISFSSWQNTGADFLVHGYVSRVGGSVVADLRLFDVATGQPLLAKRIEGEAAFRRLVAHQFSDDATQQATGKTGIATSQVVFSSGKTGKKEIYIADYDGANPKQLTKHGAISIMPEISPDGKKIAYLSYKDRYPWLYILDVTTGAVTPLSRHVGVNIAPAWAPDGRSLAIVLSKDGDQEIYRINADGSGETRLTKSRGVDTSPTFSPDGRQIAFVSDRGGIPQIYVMGTDGSNPRRISMVSGKAFDPQWSPDGTMIAFVVERRGAGVQIVVMGANGGGVKTLTSSGTNEQPTWSPNSQHIMFCRSNGNQLRVVDVQTGKPRDRALQFMKLGSAQGPSWGPRR